ncbi:MAG TPA: 3-hydroxyacyl-CoA dehydrogenase NAD-binding domain-containing protein [Thermodesulfobacteriota bacterium]|nr:3-hydroxyacyl-CoA dehydrogenase NAD-binding domain-containing protein [Thermodesulfobacteriota bacterium]
MAIEKVFIVGSGLMGSGIALVCTQVGIQVFMRRKVKAGELGRKTGRGWYAYNPDGSPKKE